MIYCYWVFFGCWCLLPFTITLSTNERTQFTMVFWYKHTHLLFDHLTRKTAIFMILFSHSSTFIIKIHSISLFSVTFYAFFRCWCCCCFGSSVHVITHSTICSCPSFILFYSLKPLCVNAACAFYSASFFFLLNAPCFFFLYFFITRGKHLFKCSLSFGVLGAIA